MTIELLCTVALELKVAVASGPARRFLVGDPSVRLIDVLGGRTLSRMAAAEQCASPGEVVVDTPTISLLGDAIKVSDWRLVDEWEDPFGVLEALVIDVAPEPWPELHPTAFKSTQIRSWLFPAVYERLAQGLGEFLTELRPAVALFLRFWGLDYDNDWEAGEKLDRFIR